MKVVCSSPLLANASSTFAGVDDHHHHQQFISLSHNTTGSALNHRSTSLGGSIVTHRSKPVGGGSVDFSDNDSDNEEVGGVMNEEDKRATDRARYLQAIDLIVRKCESLSSDNEKLIQRLHQTKKITKRKERDVALLKSRLDLYSDEWRTAQPESQFKGQMPSLIPATNNVVVRKKYKKREKPVPAPPDSQTTAASRPSNDQVLPPEPMRIGVEHPTDPKATKSKKSKQKRPKSDKEKDPNAPKRPANPFFQFCQERRSILMGELNSELMPGEPELSKQELTRQLASRWRSLEPIDKQIYINMYENSKQKYNEEMETYRGLKNAVKAVLKAASKTGSSSAGGTSH